MKKLVVAAVLTLLMSWEIICAPITQQNRSGSEVEEKWQNGNNGSALPENTLDKTEAKGAYLNMKDSLEDIDEEDLPEGDELSMYKKEEEEEEEEDEEEKDTENSEFREDEESDTDDLSIYDSLKELKDNNEDDEADEEDDD